MMTETLGFIRRCLPAGKAGWFIILYLALFFAAINLVVLNRFWQFEAFYFDHGIYDSSLWQVAHLQVPLIDHLEDGFISQFGDHFSPTLYLLAPLYLFTSAYEPILVIGNILTTASAFVLFLIAKRHIANKLLVFAIVFAYTLFIGLQNTIIANLHTEIPALLTLSLCLLFMDKKRWLYYWVFLILTLGCKQNFVAIGLGLGVFLFFQKQRKIAVATILVSLGYYFLATKFAIPILGHRPYGYGPSFHLDWSDIRSQTVFTSLATFGFLPLIAPTFWPAILQDWVTRFFFTSSARWDLGLHYNATVSVLLAYGAIIGAKKLKKFLTVIAVLVIIVTLYYHRFKYHGALGLAYNPEFYRHTRQMNFLRNFLSRIPPGKSVMTLNNLAPHLTHTNRVILLSGDYWKYSPDIIALDTRPGQNPSNFWPVPENYYPGIFDSLKSDKNYDEVDVTDNQMLFVKASR